MAFGIAATGIVPTKMWMAECLKAAQRPSISIGPPPASPSVDRREAPGENTPLQPAASPADLDGSSAARVAYSLSAWGYDPGSGVASWLLEGAARDPGSPGDVALLLLGASHLGVQGPLLGGAGGGHVPRAWIEAFLVHEVLSGVGRMDAEALAAIAAALPALLKAEVAHGRQTADATVAAVAAHISAGSMSVSALGQVAVALFRAKYRPPQEWLDSAASFAEQQASKGGKEGEQCTDWIRALGLQK